MKLNIDCIRDILLFVEKETTCTYFLRKDDFFNTENPVFLKYSEAEVLYHVQQCILDNFMLGEIFPESSTFTIKYLTPRGHEFIENLKNEIVWNETKEKAKEIGCFSLDAVSQIAINVASEIISNFFK